ncbi:MAG: DUF4258 domain-containing protein [Nitrospirota bacterium]
MEKPIKFSHHALDNMFDRGATKDEVEMTIRTGECFPAKKGRLSFRKNFVYDGIWKGKHYQIKQVIPIVAEEFDRLVVVTVYVFFIGGVK